ncbi:MAG: branched-chain amino acid ABC transporter permease/ATP-binding protein [Rhodococcus fascians]
MQTLFIAILSLGPGAMLGLLALGIVLIYRGTGILNLGHASMASLGGFAYWDLAVQQEIPKFAAFVVAVLITGVVGALVQLLIMRPLRNASPLALLIGSLGVLVIVQSILLLRYGSVGRNAPSLLPTSPIGLWGENSVGLDRMLLVLIACAVTAAVWLLYRFTTFGTATSAVAENPIAAAALGHNSTLLAVGNWFLGGVLAGTAGALLAPVSGLDLVTMTSLIVPALGAALFAGLRSFPLAIVGGIAIVVLQSVVTANTDVRGAGAMTTFVVVVALMAWRGKGISSRGIVGTRLPRLGSGRVRPLYVGVSLVVVMILIWIVVPPEWSSALLTSMLVAVVMLSVVVVTGYAGQLSMAQFAIAGVGAVIAAEVASRNPGIPFLLVLGIAAVGAVPVGILLALPSTRMRGASLAIVTLAFNLLLFAAVFSRSDVVTIPSPVIFGYDLDPLLDPRPYLTFVIAVFTVLALIVANLRRGQTGRRFITVRGNERAATSIGVNVSAVKVTAFTVGTLIAAIGGVLIAYRTTAVSYTNFDVLSSVNQLVWTVIGGVGFITGPLLAMSFAPGGLGTQLAATVYSDDFAYLPLIGGLLLVLTMILNPDGIASVPVRKFGERGKKRRAAAPSKIPPRVSKEPRPRRTGRALHITDIDMSFGAVHVLDKVSLTVDAGTVHGLIGPNGAGKTTLLDVVSGYVKPQNGSVALGTEKLDGMPTWRRSRLGLGRSFQSLELFEDLDVYDNLQAASEIHRRNNVLRDVFRPRTAGLSDAAWDAVELLGLRDDLGREIHELNYAKRRLVAIARAMATDSDVILLDEPAAGLDEVETAELKLLVRRMADEYGIAVLIIEHDVDLVMGVSDVITALNFGTVIAVGTPDEVRSNTEVIAAYLGTEVDEKVQGEPTVARATSTSEA